ncbi:fork head domain-containing protein [Halteromyces radiatus]|uniref:fork head domain-containing protein n=1 Tax=Halteromyces radiatus TaxID=101107 RepID=UPI00221E4E50|nr:fork head domain-containing protein [Halteromyces radiatus]KAI8092974.1 fork head domain-containing protein [Halteromyces radiatus]
MTENQSYATSIIPSYTFVVDGPSKDKSTIPIEQKRMDYQTTTKVVPPGPLHIVPSWQPLDANDKPPYSYATLIAHAILSSDHRRLTLSDIYQWITQHYPFYSMTEHGWQNSIRHNLSLNKAFIRIQRSSNSGKGSYWTIRTGQEQGFIDNLIKRRGPIRKQPVTLPRTLYHHRSSSSKNNKTMNNSPLFTTFRMTPSTSTKRKRSMPELHQLMDDDHDSDCDSGIDVGQEYTTSKEKTSKPLLKKAKSTPCLYDGHLYDNNNNNNNNNSDNTSITSILDDTFSLLPTTPFIPTTTTLMPTWLDPITSSSFFDWLDPSIPSTPTTTTTTTTTTMTCQDISFQDLLNTTEPSSTMLSFEQQMGSFPFDIFDDSLLMTDWVV